jgi:anti-sigma factor RsiW
MSADEHREIFDSLGAYALGALPAAENDAVVAHLESCPVCAEEAGSLQRAAVGLVESVPRLDPPAALRGRIMAVVESEAQLMRAAAGERREPAAPRRRVSWSGSPARWVATAAALLVVGGVIGAVWPTGGGTSTRTIQANAAGSAQHAAIEVSGDRAQLVVDNLAAPPAHKVYELWVQHGTQTPQPAGLFVVRSGRVDLSTRVGHGDRVMVTAEPPGGSMQPTGTPVVVSQRV